MELAHKLAKETNARPSRALHEHPAGATELFRFLDEPGSSLRVGRPTTMGKLPQATANRRLPHFS